MSSHILRLAAVLLFATGLTGCATAPTDPTERAEFEKLNDPLEPANRTVFEFNRIVDKILLKPLAEVYREVVPDFAQGIVSNVLYNAGEPVRMANAVLQGRVTDAHNILNRFIVNTVGGVGGIVDLASEGGLGPINADFGQTLHTWGMPEGPYLVLPILGPSNPRDAIGFAGDMMAEPWPHVIEHFDGVGTRNRYNISSLGATMLDRRSKALDALESLEKGSLDFYAQLRSVSRQYRNKQLGISERVDHADFEDVDAAPAKPAMKKRKKVRKAKPVASMPAPTPAPSLADAHAVKDDKAAPEVKSDVAPTLPKEEPKAEAPATPVAPASAPAGDVPSAAPAATETPAAPAPAPAAH